ncbi:uncharacterized protein UDID_17575 [Ustilago sp. UG-2017a]|nr:uncharacterized protein UDID_17575 [Ustilago sp. UG-2017a]
MHHMVHDESKLIALTEKQGFIDTAGQGQLQVQAIGDATLQVGNIKIPLTDVLYIPSLSKNLLSVPALIEDGAQVIFEESGAIILQHDGSMVKSKTNQCKKRWEVHSDSLAAQLNDPLEGIDISTTPARPTSHTTSKLWHERFGHPGRNKTKQIQAHYLGRETQCHGPGCARSKKTRQLIRRVHRNQGIRQIIGCAAGFMEICSRNSSMTDPIEICMNKDNITNPAEISSRRDRMADPAEISGKDDHMTMSHARRTKLFRDGDRAQKHAAGYCHRIGNRVTKPNIVSSKTTTPASPLAGVPDSHNTEV